MSNDLTQDELLFIRKCYKKYQMDWMMTHGLSLNDVFDVLKEGYEQGCTDGEIDGASNCGDDFDYLIRYFEERGFGGQIFVCESEFASCEYQDREYMEYLLSKEEFDQYCRFCVSDPLPPKKTSRFIRLNFFWDDGDDLQQFVVSIPESISNDEIADIIKKEHDYLDAIDKTELYGGNGRNPETLMNYLCEKYAWDRKDIVFDIDMNL